MAIIILLYVAGNALGALNDNISMSRRAALAAPSKRRRDEIASRNRRQKCDEMSEILA